jgi:parvulin-like peptidyl-prolyl isomerase
MPGVVAAVNGDRITMQELGQECLLRFGEETLELEISQMLLKQALEQAGLTVADADLEAEIRHAAELSGVVDSEGNPDIEAWLVAVADDQKLDRKIYLQDSVWPSAALKKLSSQAVAITEEDIQKGFEANYGERVRCRAIVLGNLRRAQEVWDKARQNPSDDYFGDLAEEYSIEPTSRALRGEVPPIQRYGGQTQLEEAAFQLQPGQLSGIVQMGDKFVILRCEGRTERLDVSLNDVRDILYGDLYEKKLRIEMSEKFATIRENSRVDNYLAGTSDAPVDRNQLKQDTAVRPTAAQR